MNNNKAKWIILLIGIDVTWGMMFIINDYLLGYVSPDLFVLMKLFFASVITLTIVLVRDKGIFIKKKDWPRIIVVGLVGMFIYNNLEAIGISLTSASVASLVLATIPIFTAVADLILYNNKINKATVLGIVGSIVGVTILTLGAPEAEIKATVVGLVVMILGAIMWAFYMINVKPIEKHYDPLVMVAMFATIGMFGNLIVVAFHRPEKMDITLSVVLLMIVASILGLVVTQYYYIKVLKHINVTTVAIFENLIPLTSVIAAFILFGDALTAEQLVGAGIILVSVTLVSLKG